MRYANPYTPGTGFMPGYLAGREELQILPERYAYSEISGTSILI